MIDSKNHLCSGLQCRQSQRNSKEDQRIFKPNLDITQLNSSTLTISTVHWYQQHTYHYYCTLVQAVHLSLVQYIGTSSTLIISTVHWYQQQTYHQYCTLASALHLPLVQYWQQQYTYYQCSTLKSAVHLPLVEYIGTSSTLTISTVH